MHRLVDGSVTPPDGKLTWKNVAAVAGVSKATADRAVDLRAEFRHQIEQRVPVRAARSYTVRSHSDVEEEFARLRSENADFKRSTKVLHTVIVALVQENQRLTRRQRGNTPSGDR